GLPPPQPRHDRPASEFALWDFCGAGGNRMIFYDLSSVLEDMTGCFGSRGSEVRILSSRPFKNPYFLGFSHETPPPTVSTLTSLHPPHFTPVSGSHLGDFCGLAAPAAELTDPVRTDGGGRVAAKYTLTRKAQ